MNTDKETIEKTIKTEKGTYRGSNENNQNIYNNKTQNGEVEEERNGRKGRNVG